MSIAEVLTFLGGIGLFLLGMRLMTEGLTVAAGDTLRNILTAATRSRTRAVASGVLITAIVQSSSAVIFTTVGFVNAGLLSLTQSIGVIYGSNLGTTLTSWVVALIGFNLDLQAFAMPAIGIGMAISVAAPRGRGRLGALGRALAGFGLFFLGIDVLRDAFDGLGDVVALESWAGQGILSLMLFLLIGAVLTLLVQSSSAALAITLTATAGGLIPLEAAAAMVIGANVGTTSTGMFAVIGATAPAKRAASAHVVFNLVSGSVSFTLLTPLLWLVHLLADFFGSQNELATSLAIFHTLVNLLGVLIMWPLTGLLVTRLEGHFRSTEEDESQPHHLDRNIQTSPSLAMDALVLELHRMSDLARRLAIAAISSEQGDTGPLENGHRALENLNIAVGEFVSGIPRNGMSAPVLSALPDAQRVGQYLTDVAEHALEMVTEHPVAELSVPALVESRDALRAQAAGFLEQAKVDRPEWNVETLGTLRREFEANYQALKGRLLQAGTAGELAPRRMAAALERLSELHRVIDQAAKAAIYLDRFIIASKAQAPLPATPPVSSAEVLPAEVPPAEVSATASPTEAERT